MRTVIKLLLSPVNEKNTVEMPTGARVLGVQENGLLLVLADFGRPLEKRTLWTVKTEGRADHVSGSDCEYVGSWGDFHVFEQRSYL